MKKKYIYTYNTSWFIGWTLRSFQHENNNNHYAILAISTIFVYSIRTPTNIEMTILFGNLVEIRCFNVFYYTQLEPVVEDSKKKKVIPINMVWVFSVPTGNQNNWIFRLSLFRMTSRKSPLNSSESVSSINNRNIGTTVWKRSILRGKETVVLEEILSLQTLLFWDPNGQFLKFA